MAQQDREAKLYIASRYKSTHTYARIHVRTHKTTADTRVVFSFIGYTREDSSAKINSRRVFALPRQFSRHRRDYGKWHEMSTYLSFFLQSAFFALEIQWVIRELAILRTTPTHFPPGHVSAVCRKKKLASSKLVARVCTRVSKSIRDIRSICVIIREWSAK